MPRERAERFAGVRPACYDLRVSGRQSLRVAAVALAVLAARAASAAELPACDPGSADQGPRSEAPAVAAPAPLQVPLWPPRCDGIRCSADSAPAQAQTDVEGRGQPAIVTAAPVDRDGGGRPLLCGGTVIVHPGFAPGPFRPPADS
jgi:hypothetical protein